MDAYNPSLPLPFSYTLTGSPSTSTITSTNTTGSDTSSSSPWMDSRIWSKLPPRILDRVIAFLPPPAFFRARCVCKRFYGLLFSETFLNLHMRVSARHAYFLFFKHKTLKSYIYDRSNGARDQDSSRGDVNNSHNSSRGTNASWEGYLFDPYEIEWYRLSFGYIPSGYYPSISSGGIMCWVSEQAGAKLILLCNPLVGSMTQLPLTSRPRLFPSIGLKVTPDSIDVLAAGDDLISPYAVKNLSSECFHVDTDGFFSIWGTTSSLPRLCSLESGRMACLQGKFYCVNYSPYSILCYDVANNNWTKIQAPMRRFLRSPSLVESRGKVILVAAVEKSKLNVPRSLRIWGLEACGTMWVEIERMPQPLYTQFLEEEGGQGFDCVGHGEFVVIVLRRTCKPTLLFNMCHKTWRWLPPCPYGHAQGRGEVLEGFAYEPRLATPVTGLLGHWTVPLQGLGP